MNPPQKADHDHSRDFTHLGSPEVRACGQAIPTLRGKRRVCDFNCGHGASQEAPGRVVEVGPLVWMVIAGGRSRGTDDPRQGEQRDGEKGNSDQRVHGFLLFREKLRSNAVVQA